VKTVLYFQSKSTASSAEKFGGVMDVAAKCGWHVQTIEGLPPPRRTKALIAFWRPVGAIVECGGSDAKIDPAVFGTVPFVCFDHDPSRLPANAFSVTHDSAATARMAARELLSGKAVSFAFVAYPERRFWSEERERAFVSAIRLNGGKCRVFHGADTPKDPTRHQRELRNFLLELPKPCALFAANDRIAAETMTAAAFAGIKIPEEMAVLGVDDAEDICERTTPTMSSVKPDFRRGGELAALLLAARLRDGADFKGSRRRTFGPLAVVRRASTRRIRAEDPTVTAALDLIRKEACCGLSPKDVLEHFPCSRRMAEIRFRKATGRTILAEIHAVQLKRAKQLIEGTMPLKVVSDFCGFRHPNSLRKFFKAQTGLSMSEYRNRERTASPRGTS
jgi:LacI family transcriptional regulator